VKVAQAREGIPLKKRLFRFAAPVALAGALVGGSLVMASPAQATAGDSDQNFIAYTSDDNPGGKGVFYGTSEPEALQACDVQADGYRVRAEYIWNGEIRAVIVDDDGASDFCDEGHVERHSIADGTEVYVRVCLRDGAGAPDKFCGAADGYA
jgi:hypothetical protein